MRIKKYYENRFMCDGFAGNDSSIHNGNNGHHQAALVLDFAESAADSQAINGYYLFKVMEAEEVTYIGNCQRR